MIAYNSSKVRFEELVEGSGQGASDLLPSVDVTVTGV